jgi:hypothetical protein
MLFSGRSWKSSQHGCLKVCNVNAREWNRNNCLSVEQSLPITSSPQTWNSLRQVIRKCQRLSGLRRVLRNCKIRWRLLCSASICRSRVHLPALHPFKRLVAWGQNNFNHIYYIYILCTDEIYIFAYTQAE